MKKELEMRSRNIDMSYYYLLISNSLMIVILLRGGRVPYALSWYGDSVRYTYWVLPQ